mgnify:CR=1 FL=1
MDSARDESAWLLSSVTRLPHERLGAWLDREVSASERRRLVQLIEKRIRTRAPLAYLLHEAWLGDCRFYVDQRVIVPRSYIAELLPAHLRPWISRPGAVNRILDLCTGSGCLAVLLARAFPRARVTASDISRPALEVARRNVRTYRLQRRITLVRADLFSDLPLEQFDLIAANPPYVDARAMRGLPAEYRHEPRLALAGGPDGLHFVRRILREAARMLRPRGLLVVEIGHNRKKLERAFPRLPFIWPETSAGDDRVFLLPREDLPGSAARPYNSRAKSKERK